MDKQQVVVTASKLTKETANRYGELFRQWVDQSERADCSASITEDAFNIELRMKRSAFAVLVNNGIVTKPLRDAFLTADSQMKELNEARSGGMMKFFDTVAHFRQLSQDKPLAECKGYVKDDGLVVLNLRRHGLARVL